ncbi:hypothetical protein TSMEX_003765 [Taenia solium]|eukprot:TsM_000169100 transcript=TsM_000169100 gene=TsM_000169100
MLQNGSGECDHREVLEVSEPLVIAAGLYDGCCPVWLRHCEEWEALRLLDSKCHVHRSERPPYISCLEMLWGRIRWVDWKEITPSYLLLKVFRSALESDSSHLDVVNAWMS